MRAGGGSESDISVPDPPAQDGETIRFLAGLPREKSRQKPKLQHANVTKAEIEFPLALAIHVAFPGIHFQRLRTTLSMKSRLPRI